MKNLLLACSSIFAIAHTASAHATGHDAASAETVQHMLTSTDHVIALGTVAVILGVLAVKRLRARQH